jgi:hypothetical protein
LARRDFGFAEAGDAARWGKTKRRTGGRGVVATAGLVFAGFILFSRFDLV